MLDAKETRFIFTDLDETLVNISVGWMAKAVKANIRLINFDQTQPESILIREEYDLAKAFVHPDDHNAFMALYKDDGYFYQTSAYDMGIEDIKLIAMQAPNSIIEVVSKTFENTENWKSKEAYLAHKFAGISNITVTLLENKFDYVVANKDKYSVFLEDEPTLVEYLKNNTGEHQQILMPKYGYNQHLIDGKKVQALSFFRSK